MAEPIQVVCPTYKRPHQIPRVFKEITDTPGAVPLFVVHESDKESLKVVRGLGADYTIDSQKPSGVNASNAGYWAVTSKKFVLTQDDIKHHEGWLENALKLDFPVVGFNDGNYHHQLNEHSVAWLLDRDYIKKNSLSIGHPNVIFNPDYIKIYSDDELNETAKYRNVWAYCRKGLLEHLHPSFGKSQSDETYEHLESTDDINHDTSLYMSRRHLWSWYN